MAGWGDDLVDGLRQARRNRALEPVLEGYQAAADVSLDVLESFLGKIEKKVDADEPLSSDEKALRTEVYALKSKIERNLKEHWQTHYGE